MTHRTSAIVASRFFMDNPLLSGVVLAPSPFCTAKTPTVRSLEEGWSRCHPEKIMKQDACCIFADECQFMG